MSPTPCTEWKRKAREEGVQQDRRRCMASTRRRKTRTPMWKRRRENTGAKPRMRSSSTAKQGGKLAHPAPSGKAEPAPTSRLVLEQRSNRSKRNSTKDEAARIVSWRRLLCMTAAQGRGIKADPRTSGASSSTWAMLHCWADETKQAHPWARRRLAASDSSWTLTVNRPSTVRVHTVSCLEALCVSTKPPFPLSAKLSPFFHMVQYSTLMTAPSHFITNQHTPINSDPLSSCLAKLMSSRLNHFTLSYSSFLSFEIHLHRAALLSSALLSSVVVCCEFFQVGASSLYAYSFFTPSESIFEIIRIGIVIMI